MLRPHLAGSFEAWVREIVYLLDVGRAGRSGRGPTDEVGRTAGAVEALGQTNPAMAIVSLYRLTVRPPPSEITLPRTGRFACQVITRLTGTTLR